AAQRRPPDHRHVGGPGPRRAAGRGVRRAADPGGGVRGPPGAARPVSTRDEVAGVEPAGRPAGRGWAEALGGLAARHARQVGLPLACLALVAFFGASSDVFLNVQNFRNIGLAAAALAAVSFGQTFVILTAGLDLSVGSTVALVSVVAGFAMRRGGIAAGVAAGLCTGVAVGLVNGLVITRLRVVPFI